MEGNKVKSFIFKNSGYIAVGVMSLIYVSTAFIKIDETGKTVTQIIADGAIVFFFGILMNRFFDLQGFLIGDRDERVKKTLQLHEETVERISPYLDKLDLYCEEKNREALKYQRTRILASESMKYADYFDEEGVPKIYVEDRERSKNFYLRRTELRRKRCYYRAVNLKLTPLSSGALTSDGYKKNDPFYLGRTKLQYEQQTGRKEIFMRVLLAFFFGYYSYTVVENFSYAALIWAVLQVGIFVFFGIISMYQSYMFMTDEYRGRIVKKIDHLQKFECYIKEIEKKEGAAANG